MQYQPFGDWQISAIGIGCYGLSDAYGPVDRNAFRKTIHQAIEQGVNFFDTAEGFHQQNLIIMYGQVNLE